MDNVITAPRSRRTTASREKSMYVFDSESDDEDDYY